MTAVSALLFICPAHAEGIQIAPECVADDPTDSPRGSVSLPSDSSVTACIYNGIGERYGYHTVFMRGGKRIELPQGIVDFGEAGTAFFHGDDSYIVKGTAEWIDHEEKIKGELLFVQEDDFNSEGNRVFVRPKGSDEWNILEDGTHLYRDGAHDFEVKDGHITPPAYYDADMKRIVYEDRD